MKPLRPSLAEKLKTCRADAKMTQSEVATAIGVKEFQTISKWERGVNAPEMVFLERLAKLYKRPVGYFLDQGVDIQRVPPPTPAAASMVQTISHQQSEIDQLRRENDELKSELTLLKDNLVVIEPLLRAYEDAKPLIRAIGMAVLTGDRSYLEKAGIHDVDVHDAVDSLAKAR